MPGGDGETDCRISIHAPTRGATCFGERRCYLNVDFNPRSYKRSDNSEHIFDFVSDNFNPRSYKRSDTVRSKTI